MGRLLILILVGSFASLGCQRDIGGGGKSSLTIHVPKALNSSNKTGGVGAMSAMPSNRKACYGVNVKGPLIPARAGACGPESGIVAGFAEPGSTVEVSVPRGTGRTVELYAYLQDVGQNLPCPAMGASLPASQLLNTFLVGSALNVDMTSDVTTVEITTSFPGESQNLATTLSLPVSCTAGAAPPGGGNSPGFSVSAGRGVATGTGLKLIGGMGRAVQPGSATGTGLKLISK